MQQKINKDEWICSLHELGCCHETAARIVSLAEADNADRAAELLRRHKRLLLDELHNWENKVDLLDFLLYQLKKAK